MRYLLNMVRNSLFCLLVFTPLYGAEDRVFTASFEGFEISELGIWLEDRPTVKGALIWWIPGQGWLGYDDWPDDLRDRLYTTFAAQRDGVAEPLPDMPPNQLDLIDVAYPWTVLTYGDAESLYLSLIAQSFVVELTGVVPWSLDEYDNEDFTALFDGRELFYRQYQYCLPGQTTFLPGHPVPDECSDVGLRLDDPQSLPAPGPKTLAFLVDEVGIADSAFDTVGNLVEWTRAHMLHYAGSFRADVAEYYWGYRGAVPAAVLMVGTDPIGLHPQQNREIGFAHWTAGCHGTNTFYREILRVINLPTRYETAAGHATPHFLNGDVYLSHGDDPYSALSRADFPGTEMLIDQTTYDDWFAEPSQALANIGRQVYVLAAIYLPDYLLQRRCDDLAAGLSNEEGEVFNLLSRAYTLEELNALDVWNRMDAKIADEGTCNQAMVVMRNQSKQ